MFLPFCFLLMLPILASSEENEKPKYMSIVCQQRDSFLFSRRSEMSYLSSIKKAFETFTTLLAVSSDIGNETDNVIKAVRELRPISETVNKSIPLFRLLATAIGYSPNIIERLKLSWPGSVEKETRYDKYKNERLIEEHLQLFDNFAEQSKEVKNLTYEQLDQLEKVSNLQRILFKLLSKEMDKTMEYFANVDLSETPNTFLKLVSDAFHQFHLRYLRYYTKDNSLVKFSKEYDYSTVDNLTRLYDDIVTIKLRKLKDGLIPFVESMAKMTDTDEVTRMFYFLIDRCCQNNPVEIMTSFFVILLGGQLKLNETIEVESLFREDYDMYFKVNAKVLMGKLERASIDVLMLLQMVLICGEIVDVEKSSVETAINQAISIAKALDNATETIKENTIELLIDESPIMETIIEEWKNVTTEEEKPESEGFSCGESNFLSGKFANFAATMLKKKLPALMFTVTVLRSYNGQEDIPLENIKCITSDNVYSFLSSAVSSSLRPSKGIIILTTAMALNTTVNWDCLSNIVLDCAQWPQVSADPKQPEITCYIPLQNLTYCGSSYAQHPFYYKQNCMNSGTLGTIISVCA